jgi:hypothetical protein
MLNMVQKELYGRGDWPQLLKRGYEVDVQSAYFVLPMTWDCVLSATLNYQPMWINEMEYETRRTGVGTLVRPVGYIYGLLDRGLVTLTSEIDEDTGADEFIFSCASASFAAGDIATITYTDTDYGYYQVALPLQTLTIAASGVTAISAAADGGTDATTGEAITRLTVTASASQALLVAGLGLTLSQLTGTDATYTGTFRIHSVPDSTHVYIVKSYVALTGTLAAVSTPRLMPVSTIASVEQLEYASLPGRTLMKDADGIIYADLPIGSGLAEYRRYEVPQVPEDAEEGDWIVMATVKRKFVPLTASTDVVYLDNINALINGCLAVVARDEGDLDRAELHWKEAVRCLSNEKSSTRGGVIERPTVEVWGEGVGPLAGYA